MKKKVLIAMSGGVDSSAAALLLQKQGYECAGATLSLCGNETDGAKRIADGLGMPFYIFDEHELFAREVMDHFVSEYRAGRTPNPCIDCNRCLKFGAFLDRALEMGFDYIATGHYARVGYDEASGRYRLLRGESRAKDQSYVLYQLTQEQLSHLLLPVGSFEKPEIREQAEEAGLANAHQADSQDICFIPDGDYVRFLRDYGGVTPQPGDFVDETGRVLGRHRGLECYTAGQRKGLGVSADRPLYVISKNAENNTVLLGDNEELFSAALLASRVNWIAGETPAEKVYCTAKTRYSQKECDAVVTPLEGGCAHVELLTPQRAVTAGQAVVFYDGEEVLGGGTIEKVWDMAKYVVAFEQWVKDEKIAFIASHYDGFAQGKAGVLDSMLIPAFSMLIKQGVACAVEGDIKVSMAMSILKTIAGCGQLSEMYSIDFDEDICIIGHSGSGDADISEKKPTMKIVPVFHGKTGGGYLTQFYPHLGPVTYLGITQDKDGHFKFVVAEGVNEPGPIFTFGDTNMRTRFTCGAREFCNRWSEAGPTHHMAAATGRHIDTILKVAKIFDVPVDIITR